MLPTSHPLQASLNMRTKTEARPAIWLICTDLLQLFFFFFSLISRNRVYEPRSSAAQTVPSLEN